MATTCAGFAGERADTGGLLPATRTNPYTFNGWRKRFATPPASLSEVIPIQLVPAIPVPDAVLVLRLASGHQLELPTSAAPAWSAELLKCLG